MLKTRNIDKINSVSLYTKEICNELKTNENDLLTKIDSIKDYYQGIETEKLVTSFIDTVHKLDLIIEDISYYGNFLERMAGNDKYNLGIYYKRLSNINNDGIKGHGGE